MTSAITAQGTQGEGIGKVDGFTVFVKDAVAGDVLNVKVVKVNKSYAFARINQVLTSSPARGCSSMRSLCTLRWVQSHAHCLRSATKDKDAAGA